MHAELVEENRRQQLRSDKAARGGMECTYPRKAVLLLWLKVKILFVAINSERQGGSREFSQDRFTE